MLYKVPSGMAGGNTKLSFSVESILKDHRRSNNETSNSHSQGAEFQQANTKSGLIMRSRLTRRHYSTSSIETVGLGSGYYPSPMSRGSSSLAMDADHCFDCRSLDTYTSSPSPLSSPRSVASLPQECLQGIMVCLSVMDFQFY